MNWLVFALVVYTVVTTGLFFLLRDPGTSEGSWVRLFVFVWPLFFLFLVFAIITDALHPEKKL